MVSIAWCYDTQIRAIFQMSYRTFLTFPVYRRPRPGFGQAGLVPDLAREVHKHSSMNNNIVLERRSLYDTLRAMNPHWDGETIVAVAGQTYPDVRLAPSGDTLRALRSIGVVL